jgi:hypothetical protein
MEKFVDKMDKINNKKNKKDIDTDIEEDDEDDNINKSDTNINDIMLIRNSFEYYDKNQENIKNKFDKVNYISFDINKKDLEHNVIIFYDSDLKELFRSRMEKIGVYDKLSQIWTWSWAISHLNKNETNISRKILKYGVELDPMSRFLKTELVTSRFRISNKTQLDMHCAIASYLSKKPNVYKYTIYSLLKLIDNKYIDILHPDYTKMEEITFELEYYVFLLDDI